MKRLVYILLFISISLLGNDNPIQQTWRDSLTPFQETLYYKTAYQVFAEHVMAATGFSPTIYSSHSNPAYPVGHMLADTVSTGWNASDATDAFYAAIESANDFVVINNVGGSPTVWNIDPKRINGTVNNKTIVFEDGVTLTNIGVPATTGTSLFDLGDPNNVHVYGYGARLELKRAGLTAEAQHSVHYRGTTDCSIRGLTISAIGNPTDAGGDGFKTGSSATQDNCTGTIVEDLIIENQSRMGMALTADINTTVINCSIDGSNGRWPSCGIDFEPDHSDHRQDNINVDRLTITNCDGNGLVFGYFFMNSDVGSSGNVQTTGFRGDASVTLTNVLLENNTQNLTKTDHGANNNRFPEAEIKFGRTNHETITGLLDFNNTTIINDRHHAISIGKEVEAGSMIARFTNGTWNLSGTHSEPIEIKDGSFLSRAIGGVEFVDLTLNTTNATSLYQVDVGGSTYAENITGNIFHSGPTTNDISYSGSANQGLTQNLNVTFGAEPVSSNTETNANRSQHSHLISN